MYGIYLKQKLNIELKRYNSHKSISNELVAYAKQWQWFPVTSIFIANWHKK